MLNYVKRSCQMRLGCVISNRRQHIKSADVDILKHIHVTNNLEMFRERTNFFFFYYQNTFLFYVITKDDDDNFAFHRNLNLE